MLPRVLEHMKNVPAIRKAGYFTEDGGDADKEVKSFGDFLLAIKRQDVKRLTTVYNSYQPDWDSKKDVQLEDGPSGG